ncbi:MAG: bifunctional glutamate N-acetyltransferase/amino-acid acetyltransferase ArgJ [Betaproteobacteria bacterium]|nr:bifunctional glutamate N-acetyltransferase/amino-acid acetyltransferase ArgJ [Betaproteobacteria bacterium]
MARSALTGNAETIHAIEGVRFGVTNVGIRKKGRNDLVVMTLHKAASVVGVFTQNNFSAAPVQICKQRLSEGRPITAMVINTGVANAGTGTKGILDAEKICSALAELMQVNPQSVLPFSTGVIMEYLPADKIISGLPQCLEYQNAMGWEDAAKAILTTDLVSKFSSRQVNFDGHLVSITGIAKGSGMIKPNMATMLAFVATDANVSIECLTDIVNYACDRTFNRITVDGDTSTNDSFMLIATGDGDKNKINSTLDSSFLMLRDEITAVCEELAKKIVLDGEGATKFIEITVDGATSVEEARKVGFAVANSPLVKTAFFASDPNLGRILSAVGAADVSALDVSNIRLKIGNILVVEQGAPALNYQESDIKPLMEADKILVNIDLARGAESATIWTCDLSHDYVKINADYRS